MTPEPRIQAAPIETPQTVAFLIVPQFSMLAFVSAVEPLRVANRLAGRELYRWVVVSRDGKSVTASNGMAATVIIDAFVIVIIGGMGSFLGSLIGALLVGFVQVFGNYYVPDLALAFMYLVMLAVLVVRPGGLLGKEA